MADSKSTFDYMTKTDHTNFWNYSNTEPFKLSVLHSKTSITYIQNVRQEGDTYITVNYGIKSY